MCEQFCSHSFLVLRKVLFLPTLRVRLDRMPREELLCSRQQLCQRRTPTPQQAKQRKAVRRRRQKALQHPPLTHPEV